MTTEQNSPIGITAPFILDGIFLVYDTLDLSRPVALVHSSVNLSVLSRANLGEAVGEEQWLSFNSEKQPPSGHTVTIPGSVSIPITSAGAFPGNLPFPADNTPTHRTLLFNPVPNGSGVKSDEFFRALTTSAWVEQQRYAHFKVSVKPWEDAQGDIGLDAQGQTEEMREVGDSDPKHRCLTFGGPVSVENDIQKRTLVTALSSLVDSKVQFARPVPDPPANYGAFRLLVVQNGGQAPAYTVVSVGEHHQNLPPHKP